MIPLEVDVHKFASRKEAPASDTPTFRIHKAQGGRCHTVTTNKYVEGGPELVQNTI